MQTNPLALWADTLVGYSTSIRPGQTVAIGATTAAEPLVRAVYRAVLDAGAFPVLALALPQNQAELLAHGGDDQLQFLSPVEVFARTQADALINIMSETNTRSLAGADPARQRLIDMARRPLLASTMSRSAEGSFNWVLTLYPTDAYAMDAGMSSADFAEFVVRACKLDQPDPVAAWTAQSAEQQRLISWLDGKSEIHLKDDDTDLRLSVAGRLWVNADGRRNLPDGEIFTGPVEDSVEGHVRFSFPVVTQGREIDDIRLRFKAGKVVDASAARDEAYLIQTLDSDPGARRLGEFAFGTNFGIQRFIRNILFDEKIGGTVHMAVGAGYPETGSVNTSAVHWDMICDLRDGGSIDVDGQPFMRDGRFVV